MTAEFEVCGANAAALFTLKVRRGEGMALLSMDWRDGQPPSDFVGFAIEYQPPGEDRTLALRNRLSFPQADGSVDRKKRSTRVAPIQKFRWVHFPFDAEVSGEFTYTVTPVSMDAADVLSYGEPQTAAIELGGETYREQLNVCFTRGFVSSQAFVEKYEEDGTISTLLPPSADEGLTFVPTHPCKDEALSWMGFEARRAILAVLDEAIADEAAEVRVVAYELSEPEVVSRLEQLGSRLKAVIDDSKDHGKPESAESQAAERLAASAGAGNVRRQHMASLQHNKTIVVDGPDLKAVVCGSTNFSWRGFFVQANNAVVLRGAAPVGVFMDAFDGYWKHGDAGGFGATDATKPNELGLTGIDARVAFSPHLADTALLQAIADDIGTETESSLMYSLAFLSQTPGPVLDSIEKVTDDVGIFVYGIADKEVGGLALQKPDGNLAPVFPAGLDENVPEPFRSEPSGGGGIRMHHKFAVIDFEKPSARVYFGSYNFSDAADTKNGENLLIVRDRRVATSYAIEALRIFDHYHFRVASREADEAGEPLALARPPREPDEVAWWDDYYTKPQKVRDREVFA